MRNNKKRSITSTILKDLELNCDHQLDFGKKKKLEYNSFDGKTTKNERPALYAEIEQERLMQSDLENDVEFGLVKKKKQVKLPVIHKVRSRSTQMKTDTNRNQQSEAEIYTDFKLVKQGSREMKPIFKQIHSILRKHQQKVSLTNNIPFLEKDFSNIKISDLCSGDEQNIGKLVQQKMEDKRIKYFINLYENTEKYNDEESINQQSEIDKLKILDKNRRKKVILQMAERKSPKYLYPLGPRIRVPNKNLGDLYFQKPAQFMNKNAMVSPKINSPYEICVANLESPPKERYFPTSSMKQDYLDIKVNQIIKSMQHCKIYQD